MGLAHNGGGGPSTIAMERRFGSEGYRAIVKTAPSLYDNGKPERVLDPMFPGNIFVSVQQLSWKRNSLSLSLFLFAVPCIVTIRIRRQRRIREIDRLRTGKMIAARSPLKSINARNHFPFSLSIDSRRIRARYRRRDKGSASRRVTL